MSEIVWLKKLSKTDAQRQIGNPTGDLRLTRANFQLNGMIIDQTTYFRHVVFKDEDWISEGNESDKEVCDVEFNIIIDGNFRGITSLKVAHKPSGESSQGNYTTGIRWGAWLSHILINEKNCTGKVLTIIKDECFRIEIN